MPSLAFELEELCRADAHIANAEGTATRIQQRICRERESGADVRLAEATLHAILDSLDACWSHRAMVVRIIDDLRSASSPGIP